MPALTYPTARQGPAPPRVSRRRRSVVDVRRRASPRGSSGGGAGSSNHARRDGRRSRAHRRGPGPRRGGRPRRTARGSGGRRRTPPRPRDGRMRSRPASARFANDPHPLAAAARRRLDQEREADPPAAAVRASSDWSASSYPGSTGTPSDAASRRAAALSPIARMPSGGGPTQRIPAAITCCANSALSARNPKPGWSASAPPASAAATTAAPSSRSRAPGPSVAGTRADAQPIRGPCDPARDLAAVRDEDRPDRSLR